MDRRDFLKTAAISALSMSVAAEAFGIDRYYPVNVEQCNLHSHWEASMDIEVS